MASRNKREGIYAGHHEGRHVRHPEPPDTVWEGDKVLFKVPTPSSSTAWGVQFRRYLLASEREVRDDQSE
jgi:hypothetical protein